MAKTILIAIPTNKYIEPETFKSIYDLEVPEGYETKFQFFYGYQVDQVRNLIADWAKHFDYLFSVDSDIVLPKDSLVKLLQADKDIVSGLYMQRKPDQTILEVYQVTPSGQIANIPYNALYGYTIVEIAGCGMGCCLIKSEVFKSLDYPHFHYTSALEHSKAVSEDIYFCNKARAAGFSIWMDTTIRCDHIGSRYFSLEPSSHLEHVARADLLPAPFKQYIYSMNANPSVVYDIGACVLHWTRVAKQKWPNAKYYLFDASKSVEPFLRASGYPYFIGPITDSDNKAIEFYEDEQNPGGNSYYKETTGAYHSITPKQYTGYTLDSIVTGNFWPLPDLIKIDVQGAELDVLRGAALCISHAKNIIVECQHVEYNLYAPKFEEVRLYLESKGFTLLNKIHSTEVDADYHFIKK